MTAMMLGYVVLFSLSSSVGARFLTQGLDTPTYVSEHAQEHALLLALKEHIRIEEGSTSADTRISSIEEQIRATFASLEKNSRGAIDAASARYIVQRFFDGMHGWQMRGFQTGPVFDSTSPLGHMGSRVPSNIKQLFETRVTSAGLKIDELAILIATLEDIVRDEMGARVRAVALARNINLQKKKLTKHRAQEILNFVAASWAAGTHLGELTKERLEQDLEVASESFKRWPHILGTIQHAVDGRSFLNSSELEQSARSLMETFESDAHVQCEEMLGKLSKQSIAGRVRLGDFYTASNSDNGFEFGESAEWLRSTGSLDETDPEDPKVMVANYIRGPSNCMTTSDYYSVCCRDLCSSPVIALEEAVKGPSATPTELEELMFKSEGFIGSFKHNGIKLTRANLELDKLQKIADVNGGVVPLHGRLFHQYLHHLFPTYCTFPQPPDVAAARTFDGSPPVLFASSEEKDKYIKVTNAATKSTESQQQSKISSNDKVKVDGHWNEEEHLFSPKVSKTGDRHDAGMHTIMLFGAVGFFGWGIARMATESHDSLHAFYGKSNVKLI